MTFLSFSGPRRLGGHCLVLGIGLLILAVGTSLHAATALERRVQPLIESHAGTVAVAIKHLENGESFGYRESEPMPTASLIKFPVMIEAYRQAEAGRIDLSKTLTLQESDKVPGSGILTTHFSAGMQLSLRDAIRLMIAYSDNTATNLVLDQIGLASTAQTMRDMGFPDTQIHAKVFRRDTSIAPERSEKFGLGSTTASAMIALLEKLHRRELVSREASEAMYEHLLACEDEVKFPRFLPSGTKIAHKTGSVSAVRCDAGIIESPGGPIAVCVLTSDNEDRRWATDNAGNRLCADVARAVYDFFLPREENPADLPTTLELGASGELVEAVQRTLNRRMKPSPSLSVDGEFGPVTRDAIIAFQESKELAATGIVDAKTWEALGPLETEPAPVPDPEVVNSERLPTEPPDPLTGTPFVTCKAWAVGNAKTGELLWGENTTEPRDFASTTKIMTAYIVLKAAQKEPKVLDETVVFSRAADRTRGSTAGIRTGEKLPVRELLFGLLLPSGNDAAVALAEHFGARLTAAGGQAGAGDPLDVFVDEMNRTARELGMQATTYRNPHGLTAKGHVSSAQDLLRLAAAAMEVPLFREYVATRQRGCQVIGPGGYRRNVLWKNTNQLLGIEGYLGVKTGTTSAAGACLVSHGRRGTDELFVVVLGSTSGDARYVDTRNLFRWAWQQRGHQD